MNRIKELYQYFKIFRLITTDVEEVKPGVIFFVLKEEPQNKQFLVEHALKQGAQLVVVDNAELVIADNVFWVDNTQETIKQLANLYRKQLDIPVIATIETGEEIIGKELIVTVLKKRYNLLSSQNDCSDQLGIALTLLSITEAHDAFVIGVKTGNAGSLSALCDIIEPDFGVITKVNKTDFLLEEKRIAERELCRYVEKKGGKIFLNSGNKALLGLTSKSSVTYGNQQEDWLKGELISGSWNCNFKALFSKGWLYMNTKLTGPYNFENGLMACCVGKYFDVDPLKIQSALKSFQPQGMLSRYVKKELAHVITDTSVEMLDVLKHFVSISGRNKNVILGDVLGQKQYAVEECQVIVDWLTENKLSRIILVGENFAQTKVSGKINMVSNVSEISSILKEVPFTKNDLVLVKGLSEMNIEQLVDLIK